MARALFQKGQRVWVDCVGVWAQIEKVDPIWAKGFDEPVRITYDVGLGREFLASELQSLVEDASAGSLGGWRVLRARNKWQQIEDVQHHPMPGTYPVVVTDSADWGGWRVPGAEYDRAPEKMEFQSRLIAAAPELMALAQSLVDTVVENPDDAPPETQTLARQAQGILKAITQVLTPVAAPTAPDTSPVTA